MQICPLGIHPPFCLSKSLHVHNNIHTLSTWKILIHLLKTRLNVGILFPSSGPLQCLVECTLLSCASIALYTLHLASLLPLCLSTELVLSGRHPCTHIYMIILPEVSRVCTVSYSSLNFKFQSLVNILQVLY